MAPEAVGSNPIIRPIQKHRTFGYGVFVWGIVIKNVRRTLLFKSIVFAIKNGSKKIGVKKFELSEPEGPQTLAGFT